MEDQILEVVNRSLIIEESRLSFNHMLDLGLILGIPSVKVSITLRIQGHPLRGGALQRKNVVVRGYRVQNLDCVGLRSFLELFKLLSAALDVGLFLKLEG